MNPAGAPEEPTSRNFASALRLRLIRSLYLVCILHTFHGTASNLGVRISTDTELSGIARSPQSADYHLLELDCS